MYISCTQISPPPPCLYIPKTKLKSATHTWSDAEVDELWGKCNH